MDTSDLKRYAPDARREFIQAITDRAAYFGVTASKTEPAVEQGDVVIIGGRAFPRLIAGKRESLINRINHNGFYQTMDSIAYTWFDRLIAIRYMELHRYLTHGYRVLSNPDKSKVNPELLDYADQVELPGLVRDVVIDLKLDGGRDSELYRMLLVAQCNALSESMPFLFSSINDEAELLLPDNLLHSDSLVRKLVASIPEDCWENVEVIGWLYQFYISEKKAQVIGNVVKSEDIPAATQLFTPNWIVKYLVQNSLGRKWMQTYPDSSLRSKMEYYIEPAEQIEEVNAQLREVTPDTIDPETLTVLDPACGSGHILVEAYDLLKEMYIERGYSLREIPRLILEKNLYGLDIDDRAAQLASFALLMKAQEDVRGGRYRLNILSIQEPRQSMKKEIETIYHPLIDVFANAKTYGALITIPEHIAASLSELEQKVEQEIHDGNAIEKVQAKEISPFVRQAKLLAQKYDCVVANPPYMGSRNMNSAITIFAAKKYPNSKSDTFSMFIECGFTLAKSQGFNAMVTMQNWMFLSSFKSMREALLSRKTICTMAHLGSNAFKEISGEIVQVTVFSIFNHHFNAYKPTFFRLVDGDSEEKRIALLKRKNLYFHAKQDDFRHIPGSPVAYWVSERMREVFAEGKMLGEIAEVKQGLATACNARFLRQWYEVAINKIGFGFSERSEAQTSKLKWFPYNKGGEFRKWYGNRDYVVNWENDGYEIRNFADDMGNIRSAVRNPQFYFKQGVTWTDISSSSFGVRLLPQGSLFDVSGSGLFYSSSKLVLGLLGTSIAFDILQTLNPTMHFQVGNISSIPFLEREITLKKNDINNIVDSLIDVARLEWDSFETSWDFQNLPMLLPALHAESIEQSYLNWEAQCIANIKRMQELETENNRLFIEAYGLEGELRPEVPEEQITLARANKADDVKRLISYAIGCVMGRYSLDKQGLIYAHAGNKGFDLTQYKTFQADADGILPITELEWFADEAFNRLIEFVKKAWPVEILEDNLKFIAESLGVKGNDQPREKIRRWMANEFFKDHIKRYKKRPIYWLFSSGKLRAFQCLVYLHRYNEGTLARMRTEYLIPLIGKVAARVEQINDEIANANSASYRNKLQKEQELLKKQQTELQAYDEKLRHYADMKIAIDLDDGVKVNYGKFGDLLAEVKNIAAGNDD